MSSASPTGAPTAREQRLDVEGVEWLGRRLKQEIEGGLAIVLASHEPSLLEAIGARQMRLGA